MSDFGTIGDAPYQIKKEGETITISFDQGVPTSGQGTVSWNIPTPVGGCDGDNDGVYSGIVVVLCKEPITPLSYPVDGKQYIGDPTANQDLHAGDTLGNCLVVGAFYECEEKAREEELTTSFVISDLEPRTAYYVAGFAVDCQFNYHQKGVRAYSENVGDINGCTGSPGRQPVQLGDSDVEGVNLSDHTGLLPGAKYEFDLVVDNTYPYGSNFKTIPFLFDGLNVQTYRELLDEINKQILWADNPPQSPNPPHTGLLYWDDPNEQLYQWNGYRYVPIDCIVEPNDPTIIAVGSYWYNPESKTLKCWNGTTWVVTSFICYDKDPTELGCDDYWFDGTTAFKWNGTTWCEVTTVVDGDCPDDVPILPCGTFWYDEINFALFEWNPTLLVWTERAAVYWPEAPNSLSDGTHWFDLETTALFVRAASDWNSEPATIQEDQPTVANDDDYWYNPVAEELRQYDLAGDEWNLSPCIVWPGDPTDVNSCDLWWQAGPSPEELFVWDGVHSEWDVVKNFIQSEEDPSRPIDFMEGTVWVNPVDGTMCRWDGVQWEEVSFIQLPTDPTEPADGQIWFDCDDNKWYSWSDAGSPSGSPGAGWNEFNPIDSITDPNMLPIGTFWYDTTNDALFSWNGSNWVSVLFVTIPQYPDKDDKWYDTDDGVLYCWDGYDWVEAVPIARCIYDSHKNFLFETREQGTNVVCFIPVPEGAKSGVGTGCINTGYADFDGNGYKTCGCSYSNNGNTKPYPVRVVPLQGFLWEYVEPNAYVLCPMPGQDGKIETASYKTIGIGDDGTTDERKGLIEDIRMQLGAPTITVELNYHQLDKCVDKALDVYRQRAGSSLKRGFFFLDIQPQQQRFCLTNQDLGYHKIVNIMAVHRFTSAFLSSAHGAGVYGQVVLQHLYNMGTFDLTSFFLVAQYVEQLEHLFATRLTFSWDEPQRMLDIYSSFWRPERVLMDCAVEKTEQDILTQRWSKNWIEQWALMESQLMLAQIRGKFASLPGAGGGISLNASDLQANATEMRTQLLMDIDDFVAEKPEDYGLGSTFVLG